jgi:hypothetical protein
MQFIRGEGLDKVLHDLRRLRAASGQPATLPGESSVAHSLLTGQFTEAAAPASATVADGA